MNSSTWSSGVAAEVRAEMARQRLGVADLSNATGISESTLRRRLSGSIPFALNELPLVASALRVSVSALMPKAEAA